MPHKPESPEAANLPPLRKVLIRDFFKKCHVPLELTPLMGKTGFDRLIHEPIFHRPGLALTGFFEHFASQRLQIIGMTEHAYLASLPSGERRQKVLDFLATDVPCIIFCGEMKVFPEVLEAAIQHQVPVFSSRQSARQITSDGSFVLHDLVAPCLQVHGTMVEVAGVGVLIQGEAGLGKSETGLGLIKRGHALVADDLTVLRIDSTGKLKASAKDQTRYYMEIRGLGIIYVPSVCGVAAVRGEKELDLVVMLRHPDKVEEFDRSGMTTFYSTLLGKKVPQIVIPVAAGRDLVNLVETAAQEFRLRQMGQFAAADLESQIIRHHEALSKEAQEDK